jgi:ABC-type Mn2+/Zn2+ transport system permease subunit
VQIGGIFLVFTLLIAPAVAAAMFVKSWEGRLWWSWIIGLTATLIGIVFSYWLNVSNGPAIVNILGLLVFAMAFFKLLKPLKNGDASC